MSWLSLIVLWIIIFLFVELGIYLCKSIREYLTSKRIQDTSDYRSFDRGEIVWYGGSKYFIKFVCQSHCFGCELYLSKKGLKPLSQDAIFNLKVDSREVKKVQRVYAEISND